MMTVGLSRPVSCGSWDRSSASLMIGPNASCASLPCVLVSALYCSMYILQSRLASATGQHKSAVPQMPRGADCRQAGPPARCAQAAWNKLREASNATQSYAEQAHAEKAPASKGTYAGACVLCGFKDMST